MSVDRAVRAHCVRVRVCGVCTSCTCACVYVCVRVCTCVRSHLDVGTQTVAHPVLEIVTHRLEVPEAQNRTVDRVSTARCGLRAFMDVGFLFAAATGAKCRTLASTV